MSNSADYVVPGHRDRIGDWPVSKLMSALEDMLYDNENGFLPSAVADAVDQLSKELFRRDSGAEEASEARRSALGRQLDKWFPAAEANLPALRGEPGVDPTDSMSERFIARSASIVDALEAQRDKFADLEPANDRGALLEMGSGFESDLEPDL